MLVKSLIFNFYLEIVKVIFTSEILFSFDIYIFIKKTNKVHKNIFYMNKLTIKAIYLISVTIISNRYNAQENKLNVSIPSSIKYIDVNNDNSISLTEAKIIFDRYQSEKIKKSPNDLINTLESNIIELISYLENIDCSDMKNSIDAKRFIAIYYYNKFRELNNKPENQNSTYISKHVPTYLN